MHGIFFTLVLPTPMASKIQHLSLIAHGSNGSHVEEGIHLRWAFNDKLGFPPCFKLYRRKSTLDNRYAFPIEDTPLGDRDLPYTVHVILNEQLNYTLNSLL